MESIIFDLGVSAIFATLRNMKDAKKKAQLKKVMLKIYNSIRSAYSDDTDFQ